MKVGREEKKLYFLNFRNMKNEFDMTLTPEQLNILIQESQRLIQFYLSEIKEEESKIEEYQILLAASDLEGPLRSLRSSTAERIRKVFRHRVMHDLMVESTEHQQHSLHPHLTEDVFRPLEDSESPCI